MRCVELLSIALTVDPTDADGLQVHVSDGRWHTLHVFRRKRMGQIRVDNEAPVRGFSDPRATLLNTGPGLWLGECCSHELLITFKCMFMNEFAHAVAYE